MEKYGPLATVVLYSSNLGAAAWAIRTVALGKALWEPKVRDFPRAPVRISGVIAVILVAIVFALSQKNHDIYDWITWAIGCGVSVIILFTVDIILREWLIVRCSSREEGIFGGIWLQPRARAICRGSQEAYDRRDMVPGQLPPSGPKSLFCSFPVSDRDRLRVWPSTSIAVATATVVGNYILWNALATVGMAIAATLVAIAITQ
jgi:hypothetical protein